MKRALGYALVLLAAWAATTRCARASSAGAPPARVAQGYLGVDVRDVTEDQQAALKLKLKPGK